jgi:hypothetical protein
MPKLGSALTVTNFIICLAVILIVINGFHFVYAVSFLPEPQISKPFKPLTKPSEEGPLTKPSEEGPLTKPSEDQLNNMRTMKNDPGVQTEVFDNIKSLPRETDKTPERLAKIDVLLGDLSNLIKSIDPQIQKTTLDSVEHFSQDFRPFIDNIGVSHFLVSLLSIIFNR